MPFTPAHPLAVYPFRFLPKRLISISALVIGSIVPDMEYFLFMNPASAFSHSFKGIFLFDLPLSFLILALWNAFLKDAVLNFTPVLKKSIFDVPFKEISFVNLLVVTVSALIGICTHLLWDGFTHASGYFVIRNSTLLEIITIGPVKMRLCYFLWYISSFIGTVLLALYIVDRKAILKRSISNGKVFSFWTKVFFLTFMITVIRVSAGLSWNKQRHLIIVLIGAFIYAFSIVAIGERNTTSSITD